MATKRLPWPTMDWPRLCGPAIIVAATSSCSMLSGGAVNYESHAVSTQVIRSGSATDVRLVSTCSALYLNRAVDSEDIELQVIGTYRVQGYYGSREDAHAVPLMQSELEFRIVRESGILRLESPEYGHLHHSLSVDEIRVSAPMGVKVSFECLGPADLEGRRVPEAAAQGPMRQEPGAE